MGAGWAMKVGVLFPGITTETSLAFTDICTQMEIKNQLLSKNDENAKMLYTNFPSSLSEFFSPLQNFIFSISLYRIL